MFVWVFEPWIIHVVETDPCTIFYSPQRQIPEGLGPILRIYDERFHLPNRVIKFP